ncbi:helix-turn-helix domain-containing protein [Lentilactobacillus kisonensis]|uniref:helix-turn-helix domain-containing protein n=1 Tax=Lentilactobacillus kisonensis TaxID=481722 RepID=UPI0009DA9239
MMLRNTLSLILVERQLRITKVSNDTGISRTTLTALSQNSNKMIQMETINTLCNYLKLSPSDLEVCSF